MRGAASALLLLAACNRAPAPQAAPVATPARMPLAPKLLRALPDVPGFQATPVESHPGFVRRAYSRGAAKISVTVADSPSNEAQYAQWVKMSAGYPPLTLDVPPGAGSGFYDCKGDGAAERCDLHAQLKSGIHLEGFSSGTATRADLDALLAGLPIRTLAR